MKVPAKSTTISNHNLISGGWKGLPGDFVVDDAELPRFVIGQINKSFKIDPIYEPFDKWLK